MKTLFFYLLITGLSGVTCRAEDGATPPTWSFLSPFASKDMTDSRELVDAIVEKLGPAHNQNNLSICFGLAAADAIAVLTGQRVSTMSVVVRNFQNRNGLDSIFLTPVAQGFHNWTSMSRFMLGLASSTLRTSLTATLCSEDQPNEEFSFDDNNLRSLWDSYQEFRGSVGPLPPLKTIQNIESQLQAIAPSLNPYQFLLHLNRYKPLDQAMGEWFDSDCSLRIPHPEKVEVVGSELRQPSSEDMIQLIDKALGEGQIPVVHLDFHMLLARPVSILQSYIGFHVSSIVAKAQANAPRVGQQHLYLVRNYWGSDCWVYPIQIAVRCDRGDIWVTEKEIREAVTSATAFHAR